MLRPVRPFVRHRRAHASTTPRRHHRSGRFARSRKLESLVLGLALLLGCGGGAPGANGAQSGKASAPPSTAKPAAVSVEQALKLEAEHRGAELYGRMCAVCHGKQGEGYKADQAPALANPDFLASVSDEFLRRAISDGRTGTPMSAWSSVRGGPLAPADLDTMIVFLRSWDKRRRAVLDERPLSGDATRGGEIFARQCVSCHGASGTAGPNVRIGKPEWLASASNGFVRLAVRNGRTGTPMAAFAATLGDASVEDVVSYIRSLQVGLPDAPAPMTVRPPPLPLGPVPLNRKGREPEGFLKYPETTGVEVVRAALEKHARLALLDARAPTDYSVEHIAGAVSVPFYDPKPYLQALPKDAWLVAYCSCPSAESSELAQKLVSAGFTKVTVLKEGFSQWMAKKYPTRKGDKP
jgi:cytochrome c oxidase cbb3-type subunit 3/ubiquinol-cytochrome c reductase cytochrome c subunit